MINIISLKYYCHISVILLPLLPLIILVVLCVLFYATSKQTVDIISKSPAGTSDSFVYSAAFAWKVWFGFSKLEGCLMFAGEMTSNYVGLHVTVVLRHQTLACVQAHVCTQSCVHVCVHSKGLSCFSLEPQQQ